MSKRKSKREQERLARAAAQRRRRARLVAVVMVAAALLIFIDRLVGLPIVGRSGVGTQSVTDPNAPLAAFYSAEVLSWKPQILAWAKEYAVNPNVIAIVIQIESCGNPVALSGAGAVGLMQVMPYHFDDGENMLNPDTNTRQGMDVFYECLTLFAGGDVGLALACYNGGPSVTVRDQQEWAEETRYYYRWATGLWSDVVRGRKTSETLEQWLDAGGALLCGQARRDALE